MPVKRVNFTIDETAVAEGGTGRERLKMEVVTDGSTSPDDAIAEAANQLIELFQPLATVTMVEEIPEELDPSP